MAAPAAHPRTARAAGRDDRAYQSMGTMITMAVALLIAVGVVDVYLDQVRPLQDRAGGIDETAKDAARHDLRILGVSGATDGVTITDLNVTLQLRPGGKVLLLDTARVLLRTGGEITSYDHDTVNDDPDSCRDNGNITAERFGTHWAHRSWLGTVEARIDCGPNGWVEPGPTTLPDAALNATSMQTGDIVVMYLEPTMTLAPRTQATVIVQPEGRPPVSITFRVPSTLDAGEVVTLE